MVGVTTNIPALTNFCITAAVAVLADFLLQVTVFVAVLELDHRRREQGRLDIFPCFNLRNPPEEPKRDLVRWVIKNVYTRIIFNPISQVCIFLIFLGVVFLSFGSYDNLDLGLTQQVTVIKDSDLYKYFDTYNDYSEAGAIAYIVFKNVDY